MALISLNTYSQEVSYIVSQIKQQSLFEEPINLNKGFIRLSVSNSFSWGNNIMYNNEWKKYYINNGVANLNTSVLTAFYGITDNLMISIAAAYKINKSSLSIPTDLFINNTQDIITNKHSSYGFGDFSLGVGYSFYHNKTTKTYMGLMLMLRGPIGETLITYDEKSMETKPPLSTPYYGLAPGVYFRKSSYPFLVDFTLFYSYNFKSETNFIFNLDKTSFKPGNLLSTTLTTKYALNDFLSIGVDLNYFNFEKNKYDELKFAELAYNSSGISTAPNLVFQIKNVRIQQSIEYSIAGRNWNPSPFLLLEVSLKL